jgi:hypothetical protein
MICVLTLVKTDTLQLYREWSAKFLDLLYAEDERDSLKRQECLSTFTVIAQYRFLPRVGCLLAAYMFAQSRLLFDEYGEASKVYKEAREKLESALNNAKSEISQMHAFACVLLDAPGWTGLRSRQLVNQTRKTLSDLNKIETKQIKNSQSRKVPRYAERLLIQIVVRIAARPMKEKNLQLTPWPILEWMRAAEAASGKHPRSTHVLYKILKPEEEPEEKLSTLIARNRK